MNPYPSQFAGAALVDVTLKALLTVALAGLVAAVLRRATASTRHMIWLTATVVLSAAKLLVPGRHEAPHFVTLGLLYEENRRFAGGAFAPILKRVDKFLKGKLPSALEERGARALQVKAADEALGKAVAALKKRGIRHPYVKNYVLARTSPLTRARKTVPTFDQAFAKLLAAIEAFDVAKVRYEDVQRAAVFAGPAGE